MNNLLKKLTALLVSGTLTASVLTACGPSTTLMNFIDLGDSNTTLGGYEFKLADKSSSENSTIMCYKLNTTLSDLVLKRFADVEKQLDCKITRDCVNYGDDVIVSMILANSFKYDAIYGNHATIQDLAQGHVLAPASDYTDIVDLNNYDKYGTPSVQECNAYGGKIIALTPQSWLYMQPSALDLMIFNMDHVNQYGKTDPKEFIENGTWNWDALEYVISDYYVDEGESSIYSLVCRDLDLLKLLILGNGVEFTFKDETGNIQSDFGSSEMMAAIAFYNKLKTEYKEKMTSEDDWKYLLDSFAEAQNSMVCLTAAYQLYEDISYEVPNYAVMPFPTGPNGDYGVWPSAVEGSNGFMVSISTTYPESAFKILDKICEPLDGYESMESRVAYLQDNVVFNPLDAEIALTTHHNGTYSYWKAEIGDFQPDTLWREVAKARRSSTEVIEQYKDLFNQAIEKYMTPNLELENIFD